MKITYEFDENDFLNFQSYIRGWELFTWFVIEAIVFGMGLLVASISYGISEHLSVSFFLLVMVMLGCNLILFILLWLLVVIKLKIGRKNHTFGKIDINVTEKGFHLYHHQLAEQNQDDRGHFQAWSSVKRLKESKDYFYLSMGVGKEIVIPKRAFASMEEIGVFRENVSNWIVGSD